MTSTPSKALRGANTPSMYFVSTASNHSSYVPLGCDGLSIAQRAALTTHLHKDSGQKPGDVGPLTHRSLDPSKKIVQKVPPLNSSDDVGPTGLL